MNSATCEILEKNAERLSESEIGSVIVATEDMLVLEPFSVMPELGRIVMTRGAEMVGGGLVVAPNAL